MAVSDRALGIPKNSHKGARVIGQVAAKKIGAKCVTTEYGILHFDINDKDFRSERQFNHSGSSGHDWSSLWQLLWSKRRVRFYVDTFQTARRQGCCTNESHNFPPRSVSGVSERKGLCPSLLRSGLRNSFG